MCTAQLLDLPCGRAWYTQSTASSLIGEEVGKAAFQLDIMMHHTKRAVARGNPLLRQPEHLGHLSSPCRPMQTHYLGRVFTLGQRSSQEEEVRPAGLRQSPLVPLELLL